MIRAGLLLIFATLCAVGGTVKLFTGETYNGELSLGDALTISPETSPTVKVDIANLQRVTWREPADGFVPGVVLQNGTRLKTSAAEGIPTSEIAWIIYRAITAAEARAIPGGKTGALLPGGDFFEGTVRSADLNSAKIVSPIFGPRSFKRGDLLAAILAPVRPAASAFEVHTVSGEVLLGDHLAFTPGGATLTVAGKPVIIPAADLAEIRAGPGRAQALATMRMARAEVARGLPQGRGFSIDALPDGGALQVGPERFDHGLASFSGCAATWEIPPNLAEFAGRIGVASTTPPNVRLTFSVLADGRSVFRSPPMTAADPPQSIRASLGSARTVTLRVETQFPSGAVGIGIWVEPTLLRR